MNTPTEVRKNVEELSINEAANILWKWRKYRNQVYWISIYLWGAASIIISILPYLLPDILNKLGLAILIFPILGALLSVFAAYLTAVQYKLYKQVDRKYRELLGKFDPGYLSTDSFINRLFTLPFGAVFSLAFIGFGIILEILNAFVLLSLTS
jgi:hypothetical protein